ncbi:MAG TPA: Spy/CpxP family protein refolding chaperone [Rhodocyclaceae bacterium]|nr:Spy/CpxP family protein refolding chaperone [Rhodocyclaceae bacterium]
MKRTHKIAAALVVTLGLTAAAYAFPGGGFGPGFGPCTGGGPRGPQGYAGNPADFNPTAMIEGRLAYQKAELNITKAQETAWQAYSTKAREQAGIMLAMRGTMLNTEGSAPDRIAQRTALMKQHLAQAEAMSAALKELYAVLTPEQQAIADRQFGHMGGYGGGYGMGGYGMMGYGRR